MNTTTARSFTLPSLQKLLVNYQSIVLDASPWQLAVPYAAPEQTIKTLH